MIELAGTANALGRVREHFIPPCNPAYRAGECKENGEHVSWETNRRQDHADIEIDIGLELLFDKIFIVESDMLQFTSDIKEGVADTQLVQQFLGRFRSAERRVGTEGVSTGRSRC